MLSFRIYLPERLTKSDVFISPFLLPSLSHSHFSVARSQIVAYTRKCDCTCNRISMTALAGDLTTCHSLYQFATAGNHGFTYV